MWLKNGRIFFRKDFLKSYFFFSSLTEKRDCAHYFLWTYISALFVNIIEVRYYLSIVGFASQKQLLYTALGKHVRAMQGTSPPGSSHSAHMGNSAILMDSTSPMPKVNGIRFKFSETPFCIADKSSYPFQWLKMNSSGMLMMNFSNSTASSLTFLHVDLEKLSAWKTQKKLLKPVGQMFQVAFWTVLMIFSMECYLQCNCYWFISLFNYFYYLWYV